jgi:hypothetical protein
MNAPGEVRRSASALGHPVKLLSVGRIKADPNKIEVELNDILGPGLRLLQRGAQLLINPQSVLRN